MRVLLVHPDDGFQRIWKKDRWDCIVDLARAPQSFYSEQADILGCKVSSIYDFALGIEDLRNWRSLLAAGLGKVVDRAGVDWWDVLGLLLQPDLQDVRLALRLAESLSRCKELAVTRPSMLARAVQLRLGIPLRVLQSGVLPRAANRFLRYRSALSNLTAGQLRQVMHDKFDPHYRVRRMFAAPVSPSSSPVVLLPSAYSNVTRTAFKYARLLPQQQFLLVLARESGAVAEVPPNVRAVSLAAFAVARSNGHQLREYELHQMQHAWAALAQFLGERPEFALAVRLGILNQEQRLLRWGLSVRDAWNRVLDTHSVIACLSADDTNPYTRIPLLLAAQRNIPAVACHHGALDCRMAFKVPRFSTYFAQGEMERDYLENTCALDSRRIRVGSPCSPSPNSEVWSNDVWSNDARANDVRTNDVWTNHAPWIVFFTEPYETDLWRTAAIYQEILPRLSTVAKSAGKKLVLKLHPFETVRQRQRIIHRVLPAEERKMVSVIASPLSPEILRNTWCAVTVESTVACDCASAGIPVYLCGWLAHAYAGYAAQFERFRVGRILSSPDDLLHIPETISHARPPSTLAARLTQPISSHSLSAAFAKTRAAAGD